MAVAGFAQSEIELVHHGSTLLVTGQKGEEQGSHMLHQGIASSSFRQSFNLAVHEVPEQLKPRRIEIGSSGQARLGEQGNDQKQIEQNAKSQSKAA